MLRLIMAFLFSKKTCLLAQLEGMSSCLPRRHVFALNEKTWLLPPPHKKTCPLVQQDDMASCPTCPLVQQEAWFHAEVEDMSSC